jgi:exopolysaccharide biosynthesis polyprenyl glycosylphosphotransferase
MSFYFGYRIYMLDKSPLYAEVCPELSPKLYYLPSAEHEYFTIAFGIAVLTFIIFAYLNLYRNDTSLLHVKEYRNVMTGYIIACLLFLALYYLFFAYTGQKPREKLFSRRILAYSFMISLSCMLFVRALFNWGMKLLHSKGLVARRVLIYGAGTVGKLVAKRLNQFPAFGLLAIGFIDDDPSLTNTDVVYDPALEENLPVLGSGENLRELFDNTGANEVLVAIPSGSAREVLSIFNKCNTINVPFRFVPSVYEIAFQQTEASDMMGLPVITVKTAAKRYFYLVIKRSFDIVVSGILIILSMPVMLLIALLIRLDSKGPVIFAQDRIGLNGRRFRMYKFRTMYHDDSSDDLTPASLKDPRITRFGRWLRRSSFDELPQLFNVIRGPMSLVGPRPEMPFIVDQYTEIQRERLKVKPGITGLWQISADRRLAIHENMDYDLYYVHEQSFLLDVVILIQTFFFAFKGI